MAVAWRWLEIKSFLKYCLTGLINTGISYFLYSVLIWFHISIPFALAGGYLAGMGTSFFVNARWTFGQSTFHRKLIGRFFSINIMILLLSEIGLHVLKQYVFPSPYLAQFINLIPMTFIGYFANRKWVFISTDSSITNLNMEDKQGTPLNLSFSKRVGRYLIYALLIAIVQHVIVTAGSIWAGIHYLHGWTWRSVLFHGGFTHWDAGWYVEIAKNGYQNVTQTAFWPLYPWVMRLVHRMTGFDYRVSGVLLSAFCFIFVLLFLGLWVEQEFGERSAWMTMLLYAVFPTSFYFNAAYTESMFMAFSIAGVYASRRGYFKIANILVAAATLTRNTGGLLGFILFFDYLSRRQMGVKFWQKEFWRKLHWDILFIFLPAITLTGYCIWLKLKFNQFFPFLTAERAHWHRQYLAPWIDYYQTFQFILHPKSTIMSQAYVRFEFESFTFAILLLLIGLIYLRVSLRHWGWWLYLLSVTWITSSEPSVNIPDYLVSFPRYVLMLFPGFVYLAKLIHWRWLFILLCLLFAFILFEKSGVFYRRIWIA